MSAWSDDADDTMDYRVFLKQGHWDLKLKIREFEPLPEITVYLQPE